MVGESSDDLSNLQKFCAAMPASGVIESVRGMQTLLFVKVGRETVDLLLADRLTTKSIMKMWMTTWKNVTDRQAVTVTLEWRNVEIAEGSTTLFSGDVVTFNQQ